MKNFTDTDTFKQIVKSKKECIFISPHLDDAVFSAGGLIQLLTRRGIKVKVVNVFTKSSPPPYTISIKKFLNSCNEVSAKTLFEKRIKEDEDAVKSLKAQVINLGFVDALWRKKDTNYLTKLLSNVVPEVGFVYPIFRLSIAKGKLSKLDNPLIDKIANKLKVYKNKKNVIFAPLAIGTHVDHIITRNVCSQIFDKVIYWADYPYIKNSTPDVEFLKSNKLAKYKVLINRSPKEKAVNLYKSQLNAIFGNNHETVKSVEHFYI